MTPRLSYNRPLGFLGGVYLFALLVRLGYLFAVVQATELMTDEFEYYTPAANLVEGRGYATVPQQSTDGVTRPTAFRTPGLALVLALPFSVFGPSPLLARVTCALLASLSAPLIFIFTRRLGGGTPTAVLAALAAALYPAWVHYSVLVQSEGLYIPLLLAGILLTDTVVRSRSYSAWFGLGLAWGAMVMVRPHALPCAFLVGVFTFWRCPGLFSRVLVVGVGIAVVLGVWATRNAVELGHPVLLATEGGETLLGANNPYVWKDPELSGMWKAPMAIPEYRDHLRPITDEVERDREQQRIALTFLRENRNSVPEYFLRKLWRWLTPVTNTGGRIRILVLASYGTLLMFLGLGIIRGSLRRSYLLGAAVAILIVSCAITAVYWGNLTRGRLPLEVLWLPWGAIAASEFGTACIRWWRAEVPAVAEPAPTVGRV